MDADRRGERGAGSREPGAGSRGPPEGARLTGVSLCAWLRRHGLLPSLLLLQRPGPAALRGAGEVAPPPGSSPQRRGRSVRPTAGTRTAGTPTSVLSSPRPAGVRSPEPGLPRPSSLRWVAAGEGDSTHSSPQTRPRPRGVSGAGTLTRVQQPYKGNRGLRAEQGREIPPLSAHLLAPAQGSTPSNPHSYPNPVCDPMGFLGPVPQSPGAELPKHKVPFTLRRQLSIYL